MLPSDMLDVASIGIHPSNSASDNSAAVREAQLNMPPGTTQRWFFTADRYSFNDTFHIIRPIWLEGVGGSWPQPRTVFQFPAGTHGLYFHYPPDNESGHNALGASASNISVEATGKTAVAHGVLVRATCTLSHLQITGFRGDGINAVAALPSVPPVAVRVKELSRAGRIISITTAGPHNLQMDSPLWLESANPETDFPRGRCHVTRVIDGESFECIHEIELTGKASASASYRIVAGPARASSSLTRLESVKAAANGNSLNVATLSRTDRILSVSTADPHHLQVDDLFWLESSSPTSDLPSGTCGVTRVVDNVSFECMHELELTGTTTASGSYRVVVGHGIFTHGGDANAGLSIACHFENNTGWGVFEDSFLGNSYYGCSATANGLGPYRTVKASAAGNVFLNCYSESDQNPSDIGVPAIVIGGSHGAGIVGTGLFVGVETATQLAFRNGSGGHVRLGSRDKDSTRYLEFFNVRDGLANELTVDFDQALRYERMLGFGQCGNRRHPAFLISGPNSVMSDWAMALSESTLVVNRRFWLDMTRHETVFKKPDDVSHSQDTWNRGDRAWNRDVSPGGYEGWICTTGGTLGVYEEGRSATANGTKTVILDGPSTVLKLGMYLMINDTLCRIAGVSDATLTMDAVVPSGGPGLTITYRQPDFREFGTIQV